MAEPGGLTADATAPGRVKIAAAGGLRPVFNLIETDLARVSGHAPVARRSDLVLAGRCVAMRAWDEPTAELAFGAFSHLIDEPSNRLLHPGDAEAGLSAADLQKSVMGRGDRGSAGVIDVWRGDGIAVREAFEAVSPERRSDLEVDLSLRDSANGLLLTVEPSSEVIAALDRPARQAYVVIPDPGRLGWWQHATQFRFVLHGLIASRDLCLAHAAAVALPAGPAALVVGAGGSGKSTLALAALLGGLDFLGDDYVLLASDPQPVVHSLFAKAKLTDDSIAMLPGAVREAVTEPALGPPALGPPKTIVDVARTWPERMRRSAPLAAIVAPRVPRQGERHGIGPLTPAGAVLALAPSTTFQQPGLDGDALAMAAALARRLPARELVLSGDPAADVTLIAALLEEVR